ncbi:MAG: Helicase PriA essential for oriC/DnaA-independent DNA replication [Brockia lithotrophica]|uniref:Replication restart protein PriA n=1 Tax=Brockia lithotrophica TaxID=933949 RepID=A0A2T5G6F0_9BACL|nr:MAG: Helicase PriA essential for oriC/DnaA-independent DNA replication [Brockia lithotrophica]
MAAVRRVEEAEAREGGVADPEPGGDSGGEAEARPLVADVAVDVPLFPGSDVLTYLASKDLRPGSRVFVEVKRQLVPGFVVDVRPAQERDLRFALKPVVYVLDRDPVLSAEFVALGRELAERLIAPLYRVYASMLPQALRPEGEIWVRLARKDEPLFLLPEEEAVIAHLRAKGELPLRRLRNVSAEAPDVVESLLRLGYLETFARPRRAHPVREELVARGVGEVDPSEPLTPKQSKVLERIREGGEVPIRLLEREIPGARALVRTLARRGLVEVYPRESYRAPLLPALVPEPKRALTPAQAEVFSHLLAALRGEGDASKPYLLYGVTGSGKTEIYLQLIEEILSLGKGAIVLVPEISLTPLMVARFTARFGRRVAVLHSALGVGERYDEWRRLWRGEADIAVGARSAVFAPVRHLGLIVIDEAHETSYKQDETPRYDAREVAELRAKYHGALLLLGSATPSLEQYARARVGRYNLLELRERIDRRPLPRVHVVDLRLGVSGTETVGELRGGASTFPRGAADEERRTGSAAGKGSRRGLGGIVLSPFLLERLEDRLRRGEQAIVFLNRRGYTPVVLCRSCGRTVQCPHCDVSLTYHRADDVLRCHICGFEMPMVPRCPYCGSPHLVHLGLGTERVEELLRSHFPEARILRMDRDTTARKGALEEILTKFAEREADILLGTQMVAKGLDFPYVTLSVILLADLSLQFPDFRAAERTFQLLVQVSGRAGRHALPGEVVVQTFRPHHPAIALARSGRVEEFYRTELKVRRAKNYPPFTRLVLLETAHVDVRRAREALARIVEDLLPRLAPDTVVKGPMPAGIPRIRDRFRFHALVQYKREPDFPLRLRRVLQAHYPRLRQDEVDLTVDFDPQDFS